MKKTSLLAGVVVALSMVSLPAFAQPHNGSTWTTGQAWHPNQASRPSAPPIIHGNGPSHQS